MDRRRIIAAASFFIPLLLYLATICPTVHLGDSGELNLAAATLGIPHVPGYPLLVSTAHTICRLPFGNGAFKGNLFSTLAGAFACFLFYNLLNWRFKRPYMALAFALTLAFSFTLWEQSLKIRAYPLNTCFAIGSIHLSLLWKKSGDRRYMFALALIFGLGLANHEILLVTAMVPIAVLVSGFRKLKVSVVLGACAFGLLGLTVYGYLPIRAMADPVLNWGDPSTWAAFKAALLQEQYSGKMLNPDWGPKLQMVGMILKAMLTEFGPIVGMLGIFGIPFAFARDKTLAIGLALLVLFNIAIRINYIGEHEFHQVLRYMISSFVAFLIFAAFLADLLAESIHKSRFPNFSKALLGGVMLFCMALPPYLAHAQKNDLSNHRASFDYIQSTLLFPEKDYVLTVGGDNNVFPLWYIQRFERFREDVIVMPTQTFSAGWLAGEIVPRLPKGMTEARSNYGGLPHHLKMFLSTVDHLAYSGYPVYSLFSSITDNAGQDKLKQLQGRFGIEPCGLAFRFGSSPPHCAPDSGLWDYYALDLMDDPNLYRDFHTTDCLNNVSFMLTKRGRALLDRGDLAGALHWLRYATRVLPSDDFAWSNLGDANFVAGQYDVAAQIYKSLVKRNPRQTAYRHNLNVILKKLKSEG